MDAIDSLIEAMNQAREVEKEIAAIRADLENKADRSAELEDRLNNALQRAEKSSAQVTRLLSLVLRET